MCAGAPILKAGFLKAGGVYEPGAVKKTKFMKAAFDLGKRI